MRLPALAIASLLTTLSLSSGATPFGAGAGASPPGPLAIAGGAKHGPTARHVALGPAALRFGRSVGSPTEGRLIGGSRLEDAPYLRIVPVYAVGDVRWGLEPLVAMLDRAGRAVRRQFPDAVLSVGHLSRAGGGDLDRHRSHESGRDADVSFFVRTASGKLLLPTQFVPFRGDGTAPSWPGAYFDDARNWALVAALVSDPEAHVTHLFVAAPLRARLLAYAERVGAPADLRVRAAEAMQQPRGALPHDDHFHVRIGCPAHMSGCVENPAPHVARAPAPTAPHGRRGGSPPAARPGLASVAATAPPRRASPLVRPGPAAPVPPILPAAPATPPEPGAPPQPIEPGEPSPPSIAAPAPLDDVDG